MTTTQVVKTSVTVNNSQSYSGLHCPSQSYSTCLSSNTDGCSILDALYLLVWRCSHILTDSTPANSVGWCRLIQSSVRLSYWSGDDGNYVTFIVGWCWTHMLVNTKLKHRLAPSSSNIVTTAYSTHPGAPLIEATKGSQCQLIFNSPSSIYWNSNTTPRPSGHISVFGFFVLNSFLGIARQWWKICNFVPKASESSKNFNLSTRRLGI